MYWVWLIIVGVVISLLSNFVVLKSRRPWGGYLALLIVDLVGAWLGDVVLGDWALINEYNIVGGIIGAIVLDLVWKYVVTPVATQSSSTNAGTKA
ncbi:hypothetical protein [Mahella sp.]|uniref:hypothetical protein n=1 Tax=Mahella sp. TaxID=2798721 RepID=UPI0025BBED9E|nr:hypothetical protein [Mahella sp.]MBZ4666062.1 hypothetical protein [Mahella sp.]